MRVHYEGRICIYYRNFVISIYVTSASKRAKVTKLKSDLLTRFNISSLQFQKLGSAFSTKIRSKVLFFSHEYICKAALQKICIYYMPKRAIKLTVTQKPQTHAHCTDLIKDSNLEIYAVTYSIC